jgi:hypothetical protein
VTSEPRPVCSWGDGLCDRPSRIRWRGVRLCGWHFDEEVAAAEAQGEEVQRLVLREAFDAQIDGVWWVLRMEADGVARPEVPKPF